MDNRDCELRILPSTQRVFCWVTQAAESDLWVSVKITPSRTNAQVEVSVHTYRGESLGWSWSGRKSIPFSWITKSDRLVIDTAGVLKAINNASAGLIHSAELSCLAYTPPPAPPGITHLTE